MTVNGKLRVMLVAGARPNFMKIAPIYRASLSVPGVGSERGPAEYGEVGKCRQ